MRSHNSLIRVVTHSGKKSLLKTLEGCSLISVYYCTRRTQPKHLGDNLLTEQP